VSLRILFGLHSSHIATRLTDQLLEALCTLLCFLILELIYLS
jgi:hypothetical protein